MSDAKSNSPGDLTPTGNVPTVYHVRGYPVVLDAEVAELFGYTTSRLNEQVKRNADRFQDDFAFQLTDDEYAELKDQMPEAERSGHGGRRTAPWAFTETGVVMAATVLKSDRAVSASIFIVKTFVAASKSRVEPGANGRNELAPPARAAIAPPENDGMVDKLQMAIDRVIDAGASKRAVKKAGEEGHKLARQAIREGKAHLSKQQNLNDKTRAEIEELIKKAEAIDTDIAGKDIENEHRRLALVAKQLRLALVIERYKNTGDDTALLQVLKDLSGG